MTVLTIQVPALNSLNFTEDPKIATNFTNLSTWAAGNIDTTNLSASAAIANTQLAGWSLNASAAATVAAAAGQLVFAFGSAGQTVNLPTVPASGQSILVFTTNNTGAFPVTVSNNGGPSIYGVGALGVSSILLGQAQSYAQFFYDGTRWDIVAGQQDSGWVALSLSASWNANAGFYAPAYRLQGDRVWLRGSAVNNTGGNNNAPLATLPAAIRPASAISTAIFGYQSGAPASVGLVLTTGGVVSLGPTIANGVPVAFDGASYSLTT